MKVSLELSFEIADGKEHRLKAVPPKRNASLEARRSTERNNHTRIGIWYTRGNVGRGKRRKEKDNAEAQRTLRCAEQTKERRRRDT